MSTRRPGMFDMLGRAKWDAWEMQRGYTSQEAKQFYVENMLKILRRFGDRPQAISLITELEEYSGDVAEQVMSGTLAETDSLHLSNMSQSPPPRHCADEATSSIAEEDIREPVVRRERPRGSDVQTGSGSNSHDTITGSDMPQQSEFSAQRTSARHARASEPHVPRRYSTRTQRVPRGSQLRAEDPSAVSVSGRSDAASYSFASARATDAHSATGSAPRSVRNGPMGRYSASASGRTSARLPVAGGSGARAPAPAAAPASVTASAPRPELDSALRDIQTSLIALNERLHRAESGVSDKKVPSQPASTLSSKQLLSILLRKTSDATSQTLYDLAAVLGIVTPRTEDGINAPSYDEWIAARMNGTPLGVRRRPYLWQRLVRAPLAMVSLVFRLLLDLASLGVLMTMALALLRRVTGRGDPWIVLRLLNRAGISTLSSAANRRAALRALLASALVGGFMLESNRYSTY